MNTHPEHAEDPQDVISTLEALEMDPDEHPGSHYYRVHVAMAYGQTDTPNYSVELLVEVAVEVPEEGEDEAAPVEAKVEEAPEIVETKRIEVIAADLIRHRYGSTSTIHYFFDAEEVAEHALITRCIKPVVTMNCSRGWVLRDISRCKTQSLPATLSTASYHGDGWA